MVTESFSHTLINLVVALCKGSHILQPYSSYFQSALGYSVFQFEPIFKSTSGPRINPEVILTSEKVSHTLCFEWTQSEDAHIKENQLSKYVQVTTNDLISILGINPNAVQTNNFVLITLDTNVVPFIELITKHNWNIPVLSFKNTPSAYELRIVHQSIAEVTTGLLQISARS